MGIKEEFIDYYKTHYENASLKVKNPENYLIRFFDGVEDKYLELVLNHIKVKGITFSHRNTFAFEPTRKKIELQLNKNGDANSMFHEFGHAIDYLSSVVVKKGRRYTTDDKTYTFSYKLSNGKSLNETLKQEYKKNSKSIYEEIMSLFKEEVLDKLPQEMIKNAMQFRELNAEQSSLQRRFPLMRYNIYLYDEKKKKEDPLYIYNWQKHYKTREEAETAYKRFAEVNKYLDEHPELRQANQDLRKTDLSKEFENNKSAIIDILSSTYQMRTHFASHTPGYYKRAGAIGEEFFANCFAYLATNDIEGIENTKHFLPESYAMFTELVEVLIKEN